VTTNKARVATRFALARRRWNASDASPSSSASAREEREGTGLIRASLAGGTWLVFDLRVEESADLDTIVADGLDRVWPAWRVCVAE
jgi:hypothetical protein